MNILNQSKLFKINIKNSHRLHQKSALVMIGQGPLFVKISGILLAGTGFWNSSLYQFQTYSDRVQNHKISDIWLDTLY